MGRLLRLHLGRRSGSLRPVGTIVLAIAISALAEGCGTSPAGASSDQGSPGPTYRHASAGDFMLAVVACLQEKGYRARIDDSGSGILFETPVDPSMASADSRACAEAIDPARLEPPPPLTAEQAEQLYRYVVAQTECMRRLGYPVSEPPPFQVFVDSDAAFDPYVDLRTRGIDFDHADLLRCQSVPERPKFLDQ